MSLHKLLASSAAEARRPKIVLNYDPDEDGDADQPGKIDIDGENGVATMYVYDVIGGWDQPTVESIVRDIAAVKASTIHLRVNSPGGAVFDSVAMKTALEQHPANVIAHVDGLAASAASTLILAADEIRMAPGAMIMIHNPSTFAIGDAGDMRQAADMLDAVRDSIVAQYAARTGMAATKLRAMMDAETWMGADEALALKFVDAISQKAPAPSNLKRFDLTAFNNAPAALLAPRADDAARRAQWAANARLLNERRLKLLA